MNDVGRAMVAILALLIVAIGAGNLLAVRTSDGATLWHENIGRMGGAPVTYEREGKQIVLVTGGNALYSYALP